MSDGYIYQPTDIVLAKVKGYPAWPAMIIPTELIPPNVLKTNSHLKSSDSEDSDSDESIKYSKLLKFKKFKTSQDAYCVKFLKDDSYRWAKAHELQLLTTEDCEEWLKKNKSKQKRLTPAYRMAIAGLSGDAKTPGIDVWEFVEYGSNGKDDDEEYVEDEEEEKKHTRSSRRVKERAASAETTQKRSTRKSARQRALQETEQERHSETEDLARARRKRKRSTRTSKTAVEAEPQPKKTKVKSAKTRAEPKPKVEKYNYEDDEDWSIVGRGPQNYTIDRHISPLVHKLSQKKNQDAHAETRLDLTDKLSSINKLMSGLLVKDTFEKEDYEVILDELDILLGVKGAKNEFITVFRNNAELLVNFRILFNLKQGGLEDCSLWEAFQDTFQSIYDFKYQPDTEPWSKETDIQIKQEEEANGEHEQPNPVKEETEGNIDKSNGGQDNNAQTELEANEQ
ncbi:Ioc4p KNAG_0B04000 [Huiozyma naganishii CBS 8797]|uniref:PWWP domain-containing protein n=1 Tax=Huiozyma naganishii (strain ATCC MYA-139 / BCRC 22969 / CBS 8797 / KCTC 17520 / NBRC 10181 / NCYC 3082 / Yp74L-3) TaxID=1071383 RepID=J7S3P7_HUIN7|nr:hypothetical protein KNAG_0B04000 [Kazachstania naganishii CBS 8797]CCK68839.1 hypothetical protein KNAG_0B04000 [Kazachstania naganishii CBS 8797]